jgi:hypothetical protein
MYRVVQATIVFSRVSPSQMKKYGSLVSTVCERLKIWINLQGENYDPETKMLKTIAYLGEDGIAPLADALSAVQGFEGVVVYGTKDAYDKRPKHIPRPVTSVKEAFGAAKDLLRPRKAHWIAGTLK